MGMVTWLHFADLHCSVSKSYNIDKVLQALWKDIESLASIGGEPDFVLFTGDIAQSGKAEEYELAVDLFFEPLLAVTRLPKERLFIVPGNHDIEWDRMDRTIARGMVGFLSDRDEANLFLSSEQDRSLHFRQFDAYADFVNTYLVGHLTFDAQHYCYQHTLALDDANIILLGLNSAWMSATNRNAQGGVIDQGHLLIGERQLDIVLPRLTQPDLCLALVHHPMDWLHQSERTNVKRRLNANCHFILHGHLHEPDIEIRRSISGTSIFVPTGALYEHRSFPNAYNMVRFDTHSRQGIVYLRRYVDTGPDGVPFWVKDLASTGNDLDGQFSFELLDSNPKPLVVDSSHSKRVLFVENDRGWRDLMRTILFPPDFSLQFAESAAQARRLLTQDYDLLILNLCLIGDRDYEGETLLDSLYKTSGFCKIPCIVLTGYTSSTKGLYDRYGVSEVFIKGSRENFNRSKFRSAVRQAVGL
jgi:CheY-like chemotaxis protein